MKILTRNSLIAFVLLCSLTTKAQPYQPAPENLEAREWFRDAAYGMFIHWGIYSVMAGGGEMGVAEWIMETKQIPAKEYENLAKVFNPVQFNADDWVALAKAAGMKYITITSKHHDGFAMYDSKVSDYDIVDSTPYGKDIIAELKAACDKEGIKLFFYYSQLDWHHTDYYPTGRTGHKYTGRPYAGDWEQYLKYQNDQLSELLTNYGEIGGIWFDGWWDRRNMPNQGDWNLRETYDLIHAIQPAALIGNNHHVAPFPGEDFQMFEKDLPGQNHAGFSEGSEISQLPLESCNTIGGSWGYNLKDTRYKSTKDLIHFLVGASGNNANLLLNVGPMPNGEIQPEFVQRLTEVGQWLDKNGSAIYGTRKGPFEPDAWGVSTAKDNKVYVHILDWKADLLSLPATKKVRSAKALVSGKSVSFDQSKAGLTLSLKGVERDQYDTIIELTF